MAVLNAVHVYEIMSGTNDSKGALKNGGFEKQMNLYLAGRPSETRELTGQANILRGRAACLVTPTDFLFSTPVRIEPGVLRAHCSRKNQLSSSGNTAFAVTLEE